MNALNAMLCWYWLHSIYILSMGTSELGAFALAYIQDEGGRASQTGHQTSGGRRVMADRK